MQFLILRLPPNAGGAGFEPMLAGANGFNSFRFKMRGAGFEPMLAVANGFKSFRFKMRGAGFEPANR